MFFRNIDKYLIERNIAIENSEKPETKSLPELPSDGIIVDTYTVITLDSLMRTVPVCWGQCAPLGSAIGYSGYCSVVAVAQTMSYHKRAYKNIVLQSEWNNMIIGYDNDRVAALGLDLFHELFTLDLVAPLADKVVNVMNDIGYSAEKVSGFNSSDLLSFLDDGPVILLGFENPGMIAPWNGHYWVADAVKTRTVVTMNVYEKEWHGQIIQYEGPASTTISRWLWYNWGWSGNSNGWYSSGVFHPVEQTYNFDTDLKMIHIW